MSWTSPMTAVAGNVFTAAQFNTHIRDNLLETGPAKATVAGRFLVTAGANSIAERVITQAEVLTSESTTATSNTDLATVGPTVTVTTGTAALVFWSCEMFNNVGGSFALMDFAVSGASTRAASDDSALKYESSNADDRASMSKVFLVTGLTAGSNTFRAKYWASANTATFLRRYLGVLAL